MPETSQQYNASPSDEQINELLQGDYAVDEAAEVGDRPDKVEQILETDSEKQRLLIMLNSVLSDLYTGRITKKEAVESLELAIAEVKVKSDTQYKSAGSSAVDDSPVKELEASAYDLDSKFLTLMIPKDWADEPLYISLFDDGWEVCRAKDHPLGNISKSNWTDEKTEELSELQRLKQQVAATLETILSTAKQIENCAEAMQQGAFGKDEPSDIQILIRHLALKVEFQVRRHLKVKLEAVNYDDF